MIEVRASDCEPERAADSATTFLTSRASLRARSAATLVSVSATRQPKVKVMQASGRARRITYGRLTQSGMDDISGSFDWTCACPACGGLKLVNVGRIAACCELG